MPSEAIPGLLVCRRGPPTTLPSPAATQGSTRTAQVQEHVRDWSGTGKALGKIAAERQALVARFRAATQQ